jgi:hypothetical protein
VVGGWLLAGASIFEIGWGIQALCRTSSPLPVLNEIVFDIPRAGGPIRESGNHRHPEKFDILAVGRVAGSVCPRRRLRRKYLIGSLRYLVVFLIEVYSPPSPSVSIQFFDRHSVARVITVFEPDNLISTILKSTGTSGRAYLELAPDLFQAEHLSFLGRLVSSTKPSSSRELDGNATVRTNRR